MAASPTVARWELSKRLSDRRREIGVDVKTIAAHLGFTRNYWSAVENDKTLIAEDKLRAVFDLLEFDDTDRAELLDLREASRRRGWWEEYDDILSEEGLRLFGYEAGASRIRSFESFVMPGLLQTERYTREITRHDPFHSAMREDRLVEMRQRRQQVLFEERTSYVAILSEAALTQRWTSDEVQSEQYLHIADVMDAFDNIEIRVLPFDAPPGGIALSSTLELLTFPSHHLPGIAWQEALRPVGMVAAPDEQYHRIEIGWARGLERCLNPEKSLRFIRNRAIR